MRFFPGEELADISSLFRFLPALTEGLKGSMGSGRNAESSVQSNVSSPHISMLLDREEGTTASSSPVRSTDSTLQSLSFEAGRGIWRGVCLGVCGVWRDLARLEGIRSAVVLEEEVPANVKIQMVEARMGYTTNHYLLLKMSHILVSNPTKLL